MLRFSAMQHALCIESEVRLPVGKQVVLDKSRDAGSGLILCAVIDQVIRLALQDAGIGAARVGCLEMHGTGTPLGDPIEVGAAAAVLCGPGLSKLGSLPLGLSAVKSALGHTEPAAGASGICRSMLR